MVGSPPYNTGAARDAGHRGRLFFTSGLFFDVDEVVFVRIDQRLPTGVHDVGADADGAEDFARAVGLAAGELDDDADGGGDFFLGVDNADFVVGEVEVFDVRIVGA